MVNTVDSVLGWAIPAVLIVIVMGWIWAKFGDKIKDLIVWCKDNLKSKKPNSKIEEFNYIEYD